MKIKDYLFTYDVLSELERLNEYVAHLLSWYDWYSTQDKEYKCDKKLMVFFNWLKGAIEEIKKNGGEYMPIHDQGFISIIKTLTAKIKKVKGFESIDLFSQNAIKPDWSSFPSSFVFPAQELLERLYWVRNKGYRWITVNRLPKKMEIGVQYTFRKIKTGWKIFPDESNANDTIEKVTVTNAGPVLLYEYYECDEYGLTLRQVVSVMAHPAGKA